MKSAQQVLPKTKLGEAIQYCLNQWENLARYKVPDAIRFVDEMPRNAMNKIIKARLRDRFD